MRKSASDFDSAWKDCIERYSEPFLGFFFPEVHREVDWSRPSEFLEQELRYAVRVAKRGQRSVDALAKVFRRDGEEAWVLAHVETEGRSDEGFAERMHVVNTLVKARHGHPVASFGVLGDAVPAWRPTAYESELWGTRVRMEFPVRKLLDWVGREDELVADPSLIALVVLAHLKTLETRRKPESRLRWKVRILRWLYDRGHKPEEFADLFRYIDLMMALPAELEMEFAAEAARVREEKKMELITPYERIVAKRAKQEGVVQEARGSVLDLVQARFKQVPDFVAEAVHRIEDASLLRGLVVKAGTADSLDDFVRALPA